jgi:hypothetical protein
VGVNTDVRDIKAMFVADPNRSMGHRGRKFD